jgi:hypothetical protein
MATRKHTKHSKKHSSTKKHSKKHSKKTSSSKKTGANEARCMTCRKNVKIVKSHIKDIKVRGFTRKQLVGEGACGHTVYKFVKS